MHSVIYLLSFFVLTFSDPIPLTYSQQQGFNLVPNITQLQYFPDQKHLVFLTSNDRSSFQVWTGSLNFPYRKVITIYQKFDIVTLRQFYISQKGDLLIFLSEQGKIYGYDIGNNTGQIKDQFTYSYNFSQFHIGAIQSSSLSFSFNNTIAIALNKKVYFIDTPSQPGQFILRGTAPYSQKIISKVLWLPKQQTIIIGNKASDNSSRLRLYNLTSKQDLLYDYQNTTCLVFLPNGYLIHGSVQQNLKLYSFQRQPFTFENWIPYSKYCRKIKVSNDGQYFAIQLQNFTVNVWKIFYTDNILSEQKHKPILTHQKLIQQNIQNSQNYLIKDKQYLDTNKNQYGRKGVQFVFQKRFQNTAFTFAFSDNANQILLVPKNQYFVIQRWSLCSDHQYISINSQVCLNCSSNCKFCVNHQNQCSNCQQSYYLNVSTWICQTCQFIAPGCVDCSPLNSLALRCLICNNTAKFSNVPTQNGTCACLDTLKIIKRIATNKSFYSECVCQDFYYQDKYSVCRKCDNKSVCRHCLDDYNLSCTQCNQDLYFRKEALNGTCVCQQNFILNGDSTQCICDQDENNFTIDKKCEPKTFMQKYQLFVIIFGVCLLLVVIGIVGFIIWKRRKNGYYSFDNKDQKDDSLIGKIDSVSKSLLSSQKNSIIKIKNDQQQHDFPPQKKYFNQVQQPSQIKHDDAFYQMHRKQSSDIRSSAKIVIS